MAQSGTPVSKKPSKKVGRGAKWHGESTVDTQGNRHFNCPCHGKPQPVSAKLADRRAQVPKPGATGKMHYIMPGSQQK